MRSAPPAPDPSVILSVSARTPGGKPTLHAALPLRDLVPKVTTCPRFVRNAVRRGDGTRNPAEFLDSSFYPPEPGRALVIVPKAVAFNVQAPAGPSRGLAARLRTGGHDHGGRPDPHPPPPPRLVSFRWTICVLCSFVGMAWTLAGARKVAPVQRLMAACAPPAHTRSSSRKGRNSTADHTWPSMTSFAYSSRFRSNKSAPIFSMNPRAWRIPSSSSASLISCARWMIPSRLLIKELSWSRLGNS